MPESLHNFPGYLQFSFHFKTQVATHISWNESHLWQGGGNSNWSSIVWHYYMFLKEITKYVIDFDQFKHVNLIFTLFIQVYFSLSHVFCLLCTQFACLVYEFFDCQLFLRCCPYNLMIIVLTLSWFPLKYSTVSVGFINDA